MAALWEQLSNVANAKQGNSTNKKWYDWFKIKVEVAKSVGVSFDFEKSWEYCAMEVHKAAYTLLKFDKQEAVRVSAMERFLSYALIKTSNSKHDKTKDDLLDDYTKRSDNYPQTRLQALMLIDHYSKTITAITTLEGMAFVQSDKKKKKGGNKEKEPKAPKDPKDLIRSGGRTRRTTGAARRDILPQRALLNRSAIMMISQFAHPSQPAMQWQRSRSP